MSSPVAAAAAAAGMFDMFLRSRRNLHTLITNVIQFVFMSSNEIIGKGMWPTRVL